VFGIPFSVTDSPDYLRRSAIRNLSCYGGCEALREMCSLIIVDKLNCTLLERIGYYCELLK